MKKSENKKILSIKNLLLFLIPGVILFLFLFYINTNLELGDKWISKSELQQELNIDSIDSAYFYCSTYNDVKSDRLKNEVIILILICCIIVLILSLRHLYKKLNEIKNTNSTNIVKNQRKNSLIASKFFNDENELKVEQILNVQFKQMIYNMFCKLQRACMNFDYKTLKELLTPELYNKYYNGLELSKLKSKRNILDDFEFVDVKFIDINEDDYKYSVKVYLKVKCYVYVKNIDNDKILNVKNNQKTENVHMLNLIKYKDEYLKKCHMCGAYIENNLTNVCEYCKSEIVYKPNTWIISEKEVVKKHDDKF